VDGDFTAGRYQKYGLLFYGRIYLLNFTQSVSLALIFDADKVTT
jgi:hypothetical protein